jgi:hypothetical protein
MIKELVEAQVLIQKACTLYRTMQGPEDLKKAEQYQKLFKDGRAV